MENCTYTFFGNMLVSGVLYKSNEISLTPVAPDITLTANDSNREATVQINEPVNFVTTGPWSADDTNLFYTIRLSDDESCGGNVLSKQDLTPTSVGTASFSWTPTTPGLYPVHVGWVYGGNNYASPCVLVTVTAPDITLTANDSNREATVQINEPVNFVTTGPWSADDTNLFYTIRLSDDESCGGEVLLKQDLTPTSVGTASFSWTPTTPGLYPVHVGWVYGGNNYASPCVLVTVLKQPRRRDGNTNETATPTGDSDTDRNGYPDRNSHTDGDSNTNGDGNTDRNSHSDGDGYPDGNSYPDRNGYPDGDGHTDRNGYPDGNGYTDRNSHSDRNGYTDRNSHADKRSGHHSDQYVGR
ncbi:MAG: MSCRAMM family adhesin SdrC [Thermomicrobiales bacterium]|nr:MSCRAMM family adhesin SdrC [Thermomicrobiales bacterium]